MLTPFEIKVLLRRLSQMNPEEVRFRVGQQLWNHWEPVRCRMRLSSGFESGGFVIKGVFPQPGRFFFSTGDLPELMNILRARFPQVCVDTIVRAERICAHRFDLLGYRDLDMGPRINWHFDPVNEKEAPLERSYKVPYLEAESLGDSKIIWELNRHQHFLTLGKAYRMTRNEKFAREFAGQLYGWHEQNPYLMGINWASSLEVAFRSLSWLWARELFAGSSSWTERLEQDLLAALAGNARFIEHNLSTYFSRNTHLLGEAVALFFIGILCPQLRRALVWRTLGWKIILQEAKHQVHPDGGYFEQSTYYHAYALDMLLHARVLASQNQIAIPEHLDRTIEGMVDYLAALAGAGPAPRFGDDDGGRWFDPRRNRGEHLADSLSTGAVLFSRGDWKTAATTLSEETLWLLGPSGADRFDALPAVRPHRVSRAFPASGTYLMVSDGLCLSMDAGQFGAGHCGHGHADALSLTVAADGREWLTDRGTFTYTGSAQWRERFRGTAAHNTMVIDGEDQAIPTAPFKWEKVPEVRVEHWWAGESFDLLIASHTGYLRFASPALHRRTVFFVKPQFWLVIDTVEGEGEHSLELNWHALDGPARLTSAALELGSTEDGRLGVVPTSDPRWSVELMVGWHSMCYGHKQSAPTLRCASRTPLPHEFATLLIPRLAAPCGRLERLGMDGAPGPRGFQYSTETEQHSWILSDGSGAWRLGDFASDARLAYVGWNIRDGKRRVVLWEGSFLSLRSVRVVDLPARQSHLEREWTEERKRDAEGSFCIGDSFAAGLPGPAH
jgi:hypothetical protein